MIWVARNRVVQKTQAPWVCDLLLANGRFYHAPPEEKQVRWNGVARLAIFSVFRHQHDFPAILPSNLEGYDGVVFSRL